MSVTLYEKIGDVHLARKFTNGVPLHRRGIRENMVREEFKRRLNSCTAPNLVQTGDLFDGFVVDEAELLWTFRTIRDAALAAPSRNFIFYAGNHDLSKDSAKASSFQVLQELLAFVPNVHMLTEVSILYFDKDTPVGVIPWHPLKSAAELAGELVAITQGGWLSTVFGHWDIESYGQGDHGFNMIPTLQLSSITKRIETGHIHKPRTFQRDGVEVVVVGSMQPYAHGEETNTDLYVTLPFSDYMAMEDHYGLVQKNVRVVVEDGQSPEPCEAMSFITKKAKAKDEEENDMEVAVADFDMTALFDGCLKDRKVGADTAASIAAKFLELRNSANN